MTKYGFLGLGIMGNAMAANLVKAGFDVTVWNRTAEKCTPLVDLGAKLGTTAAEVVAGCDITFGMVSDPGAANDLCFGRDGVLEGISTGKSYIDVSTVDAGTSMQIHDAVVKKGGRFLEAPVSGSKPLPTISAANNAYIAARKDGFSDEDLSAVIKSI